MKMDEELSPVNNFKETKLNVPCDSALDPESGGKKNLQGNS
jgi:hypothetical protein